MIDSILVLQITDDALLGETRGALLAHAGIPVRTVTCAQYLGSFHRLESSVCIICQTVPIEDALSIAGQKARLGYVLRLGPVGEFPCEKFDRTLQCPILPRELIPAVTQALHGVQPKQMFVTRFADWRVA